MVSRCVTWFQMELAVVELEEGQAAAMQIAIALLVGEALEMDGEMA